MDVLEEIKEIVDKLDKLDKYQSSLGDSLSDLDTKQQDLLHYIENNILKTNECYRIVKEIKKVREQRRKVKNDMELFSKYNEQKNKLPSLENRQFLIVELHKKEKQISKKYTNKKYTEEEMQEILKGV